MTHETTKKLMEARRRHREHIIPPALLSVMDSDTDALVTSGRMKSALRAGDIAPDFILMDTQGKLFRLRDSLNGGPVVLCFYRGGWCPYCNIELCGLQRVLPRIREMGATVVAISPQVGHTSLATVEKNDLQFPVLSDVGNFVARRFGIAFHLSAPLLAVYKNLNHSLYEMNGPTGAEELPVPATFIIASSGVIKLAFIDEDYTQRLDPEDILIALNKLRLQG